MRVRSGSTAPSQSGAWWASVTAAVERVRRRAPGSRPRSPASPPARAALDPLPRGRRHPGRGSGIGRCAGQGCTRSGFCTPRRCAGQGCTRFGGLHPSRGRKRSVRGAGLHPVRGFCTRRGGGTVGARGRSAPGSGVCTRRGGGNSQCAGQGLHPVRGFAPGAGAESVESGRRAPAAGANPRTGCTVAVQGALSAPVPGAIPHNGCRAAHGGALKRRPECIPQRGHIRSAGGTPSQPRTGADTRRRRSSVPRPEKLRIPRSPRNGAHP